MDSVLLDLLKLAKPLPQILKDAISPDGYVYICDDYSTQQIRFDNNERVIIRKAKCYGKEVVAIAREDDEEFEFGICEESHGKRWFTTKEFVERFCEKI